MCQCVAHVLLQLHAIAGKGAPALGEGQRGIDRQRLIVDFRCISETFLRQGLVATGLQLRKIGDDARASETDHRDLGAAALGMHFVCLLEGDARDIEGVVLHGRIALGHHAQVLLLCGLRGEVR